MASVAPSSSMSGPPPGPVFVTDFDGTITKHDYYRLVLDRLTPPGTPDYWAEHLAGRITHFEALKRTYAAGEGGESALLALVDAMEPDPDLAAEVSALQAAGWRVVITSAGCSWYIDRILRGAGVPPVELHANPGHIEGGRLILDLPVDSPFFCAEVGIDKAAVVRSLVSTGAVVAFAGDGHPDLAPALCVPPGLRFARGTLADCLRERGEPFRPFSRWAEVARAIRSEIPHPGR